MYSWPHRARPVATAPAAPGTTPFRARVAASVKTKACRQPRSANLARPAPTAPYLVPRAWPRPGKAFVRVATTAHRVWTCPRPTAPATMEWVGPVHRAFTAKRARMRPSRARSVPTLMLRGPVRLPTASPVWMANTVTNSTPLRLQARVTRDTFVWKTPSLPPPAPPWQGNMGHALLVTTARLARACLLPVQPARMPIQRV